MSLPRQTLDYAIALFLVAAILGVAEVSGESSTRIHPYLRAPAGHGAATCRAARQQVEKRRRAPARWTIHGDATTSSSPSTTPYRCRSPTQTRVFSCSQIAQPTLVAPCPYVGHYCALAFAYYPSRKRPPLPADRVRSCSILQKVRQVFRFDLYSRSEFIRYWGFLGLAKILSPNFSRVIWNEKQMKKKEAVGSNGVAFNKSRQRVKTGGRSIFREQQAWLHVASVV